MTNYKVTYSTSNNKWSVKRFSHVLGWVTLEEFEDKDDAEICVERLKKLHKK